MKHTIETLLQLPTIACDKCNGTGTEPERFIYDRLFPARQCLTCDGAGKFSRPEFSDLWPLIKGRKAGTVRSKRPDNPRAYFLWRMIRFHTGADVTLPVTASWGISGDPYQPLLDALAEAAAARLTGHKSAGVARWRSALYGEAPQERYLPAAAFSGGPVADEFKPLDELAELY